MKSKNPEHQAAVATLQRLGYRWCGGAEWKPPLGRPPEPSRIERLHTEIAALKEMLAPLIAAPVPVADVVEWHREGMPCQCDVRLRRFDLAPGPLFTAPPATADEKRQIRDLVMMVKLLCRTVKRYNPTSQQAKDFTAYLQRECLVSLSDILRDCAKDPECE